MDGNMIKRGVNIYVDQTEAQKSIETLQLKFQKLTNEMQALENQGKKGSREWTRLSTNLKKVDTDLKQVSSEVKITEMSMKQLESVKARLNAQLRTSIPGSEQWKQYAKGIQVCDTRLQELRAGARNTDGAIKKLDNSVTQNTSGIQKLGNAFKKAQGVIIGVIAAITGIAYAVKNAVNEFAKLEDTFADVRKTTGLTIEEVKELDKSLKNYDTRTSREQLLMLARDAGKLGITGAKNIEEFVKAADKIQIALGEDLGEGAINNIGKISQVFNLTDVYGYGEAMLKVGSAINTLGQSSTSNEGYIVDFTARLGGLGNLAGLSVQQIMGFADALDQSMVTAEKGATAVQQFMTKMISEPAKFAKAAGLEVQAFSQLVSQDVNGAMIQLLENMNKQGGLQQLLPIFAEFGTEGARIQETLGALVNQIDVVKDSQKLANEAFQEGTSILTEAELKNTNAQAELEKSKKKVLEYTVALGEKLYPVIKGSVDITASFIKVIGVLVSNFKIIAFAVGGLTLAYMAYNAEQVKSKVLHTAWVIRSKVRLLLMGSETVQVNAATAAQRLWNLAIKSNPIGAFITVLTLAVTAIAIWSKATNEATEGQKKLNEAQKETNDQMATEKARIDVLIAQINNENLSRDQRNRYLQELINISPEYLNKLNLENLKTAEGTKIINGYITQLEKKIHLQNLEKQLAEADKTLSEEKEKAKNPSFWRKTKASLTSFEIFGAKSYKEQLGDYLEDAQKTYDVIKEEIDKYITENPITLTPTTGGGGNGGNSGSDDKKPWEKKIKALEDNLKLSKAINEKALLEKNINEEQYNRLNLEADSLFLKKKLEVLKLHKQATGDVELEIAKNKAESQKLNFNQEIQLAQDAKDQFLLELELKLQRGQISEKAYNANIIAADVAFMQKRIEIQQKYGDSTITSQTELLRKRKELEASFYELVDAQDEKLVDDPNENPALSESMKLDVEAALLKNKYKNNLINKQEYEDAMAEITKKRVEGDLERIRELFEKQEAFAQKGLEAVGNFRETDLTKAETNYNKEEKALEGKLKRGLISQEEYDAQKNTLEEKYQEEQKAIKKKYAGVDLTLTIGKIIAETALAGMKAFAELGPIAGTIYAGIIGALGISQIALATAQYQQIQGLEQGLYPDVIRQQDGKKFKVNSVGRMQTGIFSQPSVLVGEGGPELVVDNKRFNKIMQENPGVINYIVNGFEKGKYPSISQNAINIAKGRGDSKLLSVMEKLLSAMDGKDIYALRKDLRKADKVVYNINKKFN